MQMINKFSVATGGLFVALLWSNSSFAACNLTNSNFLAQNVLMNIGEIIIDPNATVGTILRTGSFPINEVSNVAYCNNSGGSSIGEVVNGMLVPTTLGNVYSTNITGIGVRLYRDSGEIQTYYPHTLRLGSNSNVRLVGGRFKVDIVKTGDVTGTGALSSGLYSTYYYNGDGRSKPVLTSTLDANGIIIVNPTCSYRDGTDNQTVALVDVGAREFNGVGSTAKPKEFSIKFTCNGGNRINQKLNVALAYDPADLNNGVIKNTVGAGYAQGVGVQVMTTATTPQPVKSQTPVYVADIIQNTDSQPEIKFKAQYYQTEENVKAGNVFATATITMSYQ